MKPINWFDRWDDSKCDAENILNCIKHCADALEAARPSHRGMVSSLRAQVGFYREAQRNNDAKTAHLITLMNNWFRQHQEQNHNMLAASYLLASLRQTIMQPNAMAPDMEFLRQNTPFIDLINTIQRKTACNFFVDNHEEILASNNASMIRSSRGDASSWSKQGNFTQPFNHGLLTHWVRYSHASPNPIIRAIELARMKNGKLAFTIHLSSQETYTQLRKRMFAVEMPSPKSFEFRVQHIQEKSKIKHEKTGYTLLVDQEDHYDPFSRMKIRELYFSARSDNTPVEITDKNQLDDYVAGFLKGGSHAIPLPSHLLIKLLSVIAHTPSVFTRFETHELILLAPDSSVNSLTPFCRVLEILGGMDESLAPVIDELSDCINMHHEAQTTGDLQTNMQRAIDRQNQALKASQADEIHCPPLPGPG